MKREFPQISSTLRAMLGAALLIVALPAAAQNGGMATDGFGRAERLDARGDRIEERRDVRGDRAEDRLDRRGDRIDERLDRFPDDFFPSVIHDLNSGRPTEMADLGGTIACMGREVGVPTPLHDAGTLIVQLAERRARA